MPKRRNESRIAKRSSALKQKPRPKKGQQLKDEHSIAALNNDTNIHELVRESRQQPISKDTTKTEDPSHYVLKNLEGLAKQSIAQKKTTASRTMNPNDLADILSGINSIDVSKESTNLDRTNERVPRSTIGHTPGSTAEIATETVSQQDDIEV